MDGREQVINMIDKNYSETVQLIYQKIDFWSKNVVFSDLWWTGVVLTIVPWILWYMYRRRESTDRLIYAGLLTMAISLVLDISGDQLGIWHYRYNVVPFLPTYFPWDLTLMPVGIMTFLQIKPKVNPWVKAIAFGLASSYLAEPLFHWLKVYQPDQWRYSYSVPIQIVIFMLASYISKRNRLSDLS
ncbi:MAG: CBO0543 family protein [Bacillota bacterium]|nr:CBO0543 family protein [Bacillota bacterium]